MYIVMDHRLAHRSQPGPLVDEQGYAKLKRETELTKSKTLCSLFPQQYSNYLQMRLV